MTLQDTVPEIAQSIIIATILSPPTMRSIFFSLEN